MNASAIKYIDSDSMIHISKSYKLTCEYDGDKPDQVGIPELNLVLKKGNWLIKIEGNFLVCDDGARSVLYGDVCPIHNLELISKKQDLGQMIGNTVRAVIRQEQLGQVIGDLGSAPHITEMKSQINALATSVATLSCRVDALSGDK